MWQEYCYSLVCYLSRLMGILNQRHCSQLALRLGVISNKSKNLCFGMRKILFPLQLVSGQSLSLSSISPASVPGPLMMTSVSPRSFQQFKISSRIDSNVILVTRKSFILGDRSWFCHQIGVLYLKCRVETLRGLLINKPECKFKIQILNSFLRPDIKVLQNNICASPSIKVVSVRHKAWAGLLGVSRAAVHCGKLWKPDGQSFYKLKWADLWRF